MQTDICLVNMPYSSITIPSMALGVIETYIKEYNHSVETIYANLNFASIIGIAEYEMIDESFNDYLIGEWTFAKATFPDAKHDDEGFFALFTDLTDDKKRVLNEIRDKATAFVDSVAHKVIAKKPKIVGSSSTFQQNCAALALLRKVKELAPDTITMLGGANCEGIMGQTLSENFTWLDFVFSGECDEVIGPFIDKLMKDEPIDSRSLPEGFISQKYKSLATDVGCNDNKPPRAYISDMSAVGMPIFDAYFDTLNELKFDRYISPGLVAETSRGCWWGAKQHCTFCGLNGGTMKHRSKTPEAASAELASLSKKYNIDKFLIVDNILPVEYVKTLLPDLAENHDLKIFYETKANLKRHHVEAYAKAGIRWIQPGIEGMHDDFLKLIKKGTTAIQNVAALKWSRCYGVVVAWNLLVEAPHEQESWYEEIAEWLPLIYHLTPPYNQMAKICYHRFSPYFNKPEEYGITLEPTKSYKYIYPVDQQSIFNLAYFFRQYTPQEKGVYTLNFSFSPKTEGHRKVQERIDHWCKLWSEDDTPTLYMIDKQDHMFFVDTREVATSYTHVVKGVATEIYRLAEEPIPRERLIKKVLERTQYQDVEEIEAQIDWLIENKLMIHLSKCLMALALIGDVTPMPAYIDSPGGVILHENLPEPELIN